MLVRIAQSIYYHIACVGGECKCCSTLLLTAAAACRPPPAARRRRRCVEMADRHAFTVEFLEKGRFSKQHFTEDLEIYEALQETGEIDILRPKRNGNLAQAIACNDVGFLDFLQTVLQINPVDRPYASEVRVAAGGSLASPFIDLCLASRIITVVAAVCRLWSIAGCRTTTLRHPRRPRPSRRKWYPSRSRSPLRSQRLRQLR